MLRRSHASLLPLAALVTAAAWCSRAVLDLVPGGTGSIRVAMLPPPLTVLPIVVLVFGGLWAWLLLIGRLRRRRVVDATAGALAPVQVVAPLYAVGITVLPFLPVASDALPVLRAFAGPLGTLVWALSGAAAVVSSLHWAYAGDRREPAPGEAVRPARGEPGWGIPVLLVLASMAVVGAASWRLTSTPLMPGGDEPHYLVLAQSIWTDHDLKIQDNHDRGDYRAYYDRQLAPHYLTRGADQEIYSIHPVGLPVLIAPVYALGGYRLVVFTLVFVGACAAAWMWRFTRAFTGSGTAATIAWGTLAFSVTFIFNSMSVYPEIVGALCVVAAITAGWPRELGGSDAMGRWWLAGLSVAFLPWLATKYAFLAGALGLVLLLRAIARPDATEAFGSWWRTGWPLRVAAVVVPGTVSLVLWLAFFKWIWGIASPAAPYGALTQTRPEYLLVGGPGLLFDQEYGLAAYTPAILLAGAGWWVMLRGGGPARRLAAESMVAFAALLGAVGAFRIWWGDAAPGRPVTAGLLLGAVPIAWYYATAPRGSARRAWTVVLSLAGLAISAAAVIVQNGGLIASSRDGLSRMLQWLGATSDVWTLAPSYIAHAWPLASAMALGWLVAFALASWGLSLVAGADESPARWPANLLAALLAAFAVLVVVAVAFPPVFGTRLQEPAPLDARSRSALIDGYSSTERPLAVAFDPFTLSAASEVVSLVRFRAVPGEWTDPQPVPLLLNMRLSLPAGRYRVTVVFAPLPPGPHRLGLRLGRVGGFYKMFDVPGSGSSWVGEFDVPVDANFVGFEASKDLAAAVKRVDVTPLAVSDARRRLRVPQVLAARDYGAASVFSHDERSWLEPEGAWMQGAARVSLTLSPQREPLVLRLRSGIDTTVQLGTSSWNSSVEVHAEQPVTVEVPGLERGRAVPLWIETSGGYAPVERDPAVRDRRFLGVFVEFTDGAAASQP